MKQILSILTFILFLSFLTACSSSSSSSHFENSSSSTTQQSAVEETREDGDSPKQSPNKDDKILVVYFSRVGVTPFDDTVDVVSSASLNLRNGEFVGNMEYLADFIVNSTGGDRFQVYTEREYPISYEETTQVASAEQERDERPVLTNHVDDMDQYDIIFLGYPTWWGTLPQPLVTFLEEYNFSGKTIVPFCSHGGSGLADGPSRIQTLCPDATVLEGLAIPASSVVNAQEDVETWLSGLDLPTLQISN